ncbi:RNA-binding domain superfamily [Sesbania bispinosa]|nr:RNA-binding domain superfamily [Sesbania bispinosa]
MAAVADIPADANKMDSKPKPESEFTVQKLVDMFTKLNPLAKEFFPSSYSHNLDHRHQGYNQFTPTNFLVNTKPSPNDNFPNNRRRRNNFNQGRRRLNGRSLKAQREDSVRRTVYVSDIDQHVTEERLAALFSSCGQKSRCIVFLWNGDTGLTGEQIVIVAVAAAMNDIVAPFLHTICPLTSVVSASSSRLCSQFILAGLPFYAATSSMIPYPWHRLSHNQPNRTPQPQSLLIVIDCRICGDPHSVLRFAFVEFADEHGARAALNLGGTVLGYYPVRVLPSKTAILPVNPTFLPRSDDEREMCTRTVYCTNIDKKVSQAEVKNFFESACGEVTRLRLLGDHVHSTRIAFVEFALAESAIIALNCSGMLLGTQPIRFGAFSGR